MAELTTQLAIFLKNVPGALRDLLGSLADAGINISGIMVSDAADHAVVRLVVDTPSKAIHLLGDQGAVVVDSELISHDMTDEPGELLSLAGKLADHQINILYIYGSTCRAGGVARTFIHTSNDEKVLEILGG